MVSEILFEIKELAITFLNIRILNKVSLSFSGGEIHAIIGMKGAGKSVIANILGGVISSHRYSGELQLNNEELKLRSFKDSEDAGFSVVFQQQSLFENMKVFENIFVGREIINNGVISIENEVERSSQILEELGVMIDLDTKVGFLSYGEQHLVKIARALSQEADIYVLDEPAAGLTERELTSLFRILKRLRDGGKIVIYLTHEPKDAIRIADKISILKNGSIIATELNKGLNDEYLLIAMTGRNKVRSNSLDTVLSECGVTDREKDIIKYLLKGYSNKEISDKLFISINTVKTHIANIYQKFQVTGRVELANLINEKL